MNKKIAAIILALMMTTCLFTGCSHEDSPVDATQAFGVNVTAEKAFLGNVESTATYTGTLTAKDMAYVTSKVNAKVKTINAEIGDWVEKGDLLMVLDSSDYQYQLSQAEASYAQAEAGFNSASNSLNNVSGASEQSKVQLESALNSATIAYNNAKTNFERQKQLYEMGAISLVAYESAEASLENATLQYESAKKNYEIVTNVITPGNEASAKSGVETAKAAMNAASLAISQAKENIAATRITAPISGYVSSKNIVLGQFATTGSPLFVISNSENLEAEINVTESVIPFVKVGSKAQVVISSAKCTLEGEVRVVNPVKNAQTGMYTVRVSVPNEEGTLKIGMFADITLYTEEGVENAVCVPSEAIMQEGEEFYVFVAEDGLAQKRIVECGVSDGEYTQIISGVCEGESIICEGKEYISETNNSVNIVE